MSSKVVIAVAMKDESIEQLKKLKGSPLLKNADIHLVHVFKSEVFVNELSPYFYPDPEQQKEIKQTVLKILEGLGDELVNGGELSYYVDFHNDPKEKMVEYIASEKPDCLVVATKGKKGLEGLFNSSFAEYMNRHSPCDLYILRPTS